MPKSATKSPAPSPPKYVATPSRSPKKKKRKKKNLKTWEGEVLQSMTTSVTNPRHAMYAWYVTPNKI